MKIRFQFDWKKTSFNSSITLTFDLWIKLYFLIQKMLFKINVNFISQYRDKKIIGNYNQETNVKAIKFYISLVILIFSYNVNCLK